jgi:hypothetical protein
MIRFNTGRLYTSQGQRIGAMLIDGGILFTDIDRGIDGFVSADKVKALELELTQPDVLWAYDHHDKSNCYGYHPELSYARRAELLPQLRAFAASEDK